MTDENKIGESKIGENLSAGSFKSAGCDEMSSVHEEAIKMAQRHACFTKNARHIKMNNGTGLSLTRLFQRLRHKDQYEHAGEARE